MVTMEPRAIEPPMLMGATISPTSAAFSVTMPSKGERTKDFVTLAFEDLDACSGGVLSGFGRHDRGPRGGRLCLDHGNLLFRLEFPLLRPGDLGVHGEHFRAAVIDLGRANGGTGRKLFVAFQAALGVGQEDLVLLVLGDQGLQGRFGSREFGGGLVGEPGQTLHFGGGFGHFRLGLSDRGVQLAVVEFRDDVPLLDELRFGHVQLGEPSGEFRGQHRLPVRHDIAGGGEFGAAVRRFARRGGNPGGGRDADFRHLQPPNQTRGQDACGQDGDQDNPHPGRYAPSPTRSVDSQRRQAIRGRHCRSTHASRHIRPNVKRKVPAAVRRAVAL